MKTCIKMEEKIIKFGDIELKKQKFHQHKSQQHFNKKYGFWLHPSSKKVSFGKKKDLNISLATKMLKK